MIYKIENPDLRHHHLNREKVVGVGDPQNTCLHVGFFGGYLRQSGCLLFVQFCSQLKFCFDELKHILLVGFAHVLPLLQPLLKISSPSM